MSDGGSALFDDLNNPLVDRVVKLETAQIRSERDLAYDIAKEEMRKNMRAEIEEESRAARPNLRVL